MAIGTSIGIPFSKSTFDWDAYWAARLALHYTSRSGFDLLETQSGESINAKILPSCQQVIDNTASHTQIDVINGYFEVHFKETGSLGTTPCIIGSATTAYAIAVSTSTAVRVRMNSINKTFVIPTFDQTIKNILRVELSNATGQTLARVFMNGVESVTGAQGFTADTTYAFPWTRMGAGAGYIAGEIYYYKVVEAGSTVCECYPTGLGAYNYDISGNNNHGLFNSPTNNHIAYSLNAYTYYLDNGYRIFTKAATANEYVPVGVDTTTIETDGYILYRSFTGSSSIINQGVDSLLSVIDFDPDEGTNALLDIFDKSNATIHIATGSMDYYDASYPYRWRIDELGNNNLFNEYFNADYQLMLFIKALVIYNDPNYDNLNLEEILVAIDPQTGAAFWKAIDYCLHTE